MPSSRIRGGRRLAGALVALALVGAGVWMALTVGNPFPPDTLVMATGPDGSAYPELGARYREILGRAGIDLRVIKTAGGAENLARLRDRPAGVKVAFLESGLTTPEDSPDLVREITNLGRKGNGSDAGTHSRMMAQRPGRTLTVSAGRLVCPALAGPFARRTSCRAFFASAPIVVRGAIGCGKSVR